MKSPQEIASRLVITGSNGAILLELGEEILDEVTPFVHLAVIRPWLSAIGFWRNHRLTVSGLQTLEDALGGIISLVSQ